MAKIEIGKLAHEPLPIDQAGKIFIGEQNTLVIDGVRCTMELLVQCMTPDPTRYFRAERRGDELFVTSYTRESLVTELTGKAAS